jgi:ATP-dependent helicase/nuclease subunit A
VQLLTVHGAKGLEADVVLLLNSDPQKRNLQNMTTLIDWQPEHPVPQKFVFLLSESNPPACAKGLLADDFKARDLEELNALYVAATRAKRTLVVSASKAKNQNLNSVWHRLHALCSPAAKPPFALNLPTGGSNKSKDLDKLSPNGIGSSSVSLTLPSAESVAVAEAPTEASRMGSALHRLLQWQNTSAAALAKAVREFALTPEQGQAVLMQASAVLTGEAAWLWDETQLDWQANEYELFHEGRALRIDRLVRQRETKLWWVIDFKSAAQPERSESLRMQLANYALAVSAVMHIPKSQIRTAFVTSAGLILA